MQEKFEWGGGNAIFLFRDFFFPSIKFSGNREVKVWLAGGSSDAIFRSSHGPAVSKRMRRRPSAGSDFRSFACAAVRAKSPPLPEQVEKLRAAFQEAAEVNGFS